jgi:putative aldouronate transport system substrate-binding protein
MKRVILCVFLAILGACLVWSAGSSESKAAAGKAPPLTIRLSYHPEIDKTMAPNNIDFNNNRIANFHREKSGVNVTFEPALADGTQESQKKAMILASNDTPDLMDMNRTEYYKYAMQGVFVETESYLTKMPDYVKLVPKDVLEAPRFKGKLYCFPTVLEEQDLNRTTAGGLMVRQDVLDTLGFAVPKTIDEYYTMFKTVKAKTKLVPLASAGDGFGAIKAAFRVALDYKEKGDKLEYIWVQPEYKAYLAYMNKLYAEGLLDNEYITMNTTRLVEKFMGDQAFSTVRDWTFAVVNIRDIATKIPGAKLAYLPQPTGPDGAKALLFNNWPVQRMWVVPVSAKNKDAAAKFMNYMATPESKMVQDYGMQGKDYTLDAGGKPSFTAQQQADVTWKICYEVMATPASFKVRLVAKSYDWAYNQGLAGQKGHDIAFNLLSLLPPDDTFQKIQQRLALGTVVTEETAKFISGARPIAEFDKFVDEINKKGLIEQTAALNTWYAANKAK